MTIASQTSRISYTGDGSTTAFPVPFYFAANADLVVILTNTLGVQTLQTLGTHYNLTGATVSSGGTCTFVTAPTTGYTVSIYRDPPVTQTTSYNNNDPFPAKSHETALDKLTTIAQRVKDLVGRALHLPEGEATTTAELGSVATRKNKLLGFGTSGELVYAAGPTYVGVTATGVADVDSRATAQITNFAVSVTTVATKGFATAGDGGGATYKAGISSSPGAFQDAGGKWWGLEITGRPVPVECFGAVGDGTTNDTTAVAAAVLAAYTNGFSLYLTNTYLTNATIPQFHSVQYMGLGTIKRGTDIFQPNAVPSRTNTIYVATSGLDTNDGLSSSQPLLTPQAAVNLWGWYGPALTGHWQVILAAGTYNNGVLIPENITEVTTAVVYPFNRPTIKGPSVGASPAVPTAIINGGSSPTTNYGILCNGGNVLYVKDIKFTNWNGTASTYGVNSGEMSDIYLDNCHFSSCSFGTISRLSRFYQIGGIVNACVQGATMLNATTYTFTGVTISNCTVYGINVAEGSQGHFDTGTINNCVVGAYMVEQSHMQISGTVSNNITVGIQVAVNSSYYDAGVTFTSNAINLLRYSGSYEVSNTYNFPTALRIGYNDTLVSVGTGTTTEGTLYASLGVIPANIFQSGNNVITVKISGLFGGNQNTRTLRLKAGGTTIATLTLAGNATATNSSFDAEFSWSASSLTAQLANARLRTSITPYYSALNNSSTAVDMSTAKTLSLTGQLADVADQIVVYHAEVWMT